MVRPRVPSILMMTLCLSIPLAVGACGVASDHPLIVGESEPIPDYLIGQWDVVKLVGLTHDGSSGTYVLMDRNPDGSLHVTLGESGRTLEMDASLSVLAGNNILSLMPEAEDGLWTFLSYVYDDEGQTLTVTSLEHEVIIQDIGLGRVEGEVYSFDEDALARLTASTSALRGYFATYGHGFNDPIAVLSKRSQE